VKTHGTDDLVRSFKTKHQFMALLFALMNPLIFVGLGKA
jgi:hypothetical protein